MNKIVYTTFIAVVLLGILYFVSRYNYFADLERKLIPISFVGRIDSMRDLTRGSYYMKIVTQDSIIELQSLPLAYDVKQTNLKIGDSVRKEHHSHKILFFRAGSGKGSDLFEYHISR